MSIFSSTRQLQSPADRWMLRACLLLPLAALIVFFGVPMLSIAWRSLIDDHSGVIGLSNYIALTDAPGIWRAVGNSLILGVATTVITVFLGLIVAFGIERTAMPGKRFMSMTMSLPVLAPSLILGLGLIFLLGRNGIIGKMLGIRTDIYGFWGLLLADVLYALPEAILIIRAALRHGDARQYEAAEMLGASGWRQFMDITLPGVRYGLLSAAFVVFTITITDFGNAIVIGGNFSVLATEIYNQVSGQMKFGMGAVVGILLLLPAAGSIWIERFATQRQSASGHHAATPPVAKPLPARDIPVFLVSLLTSLSIVVVVAIVVYASFMQLWPYKMSFSLKHYDITIAGGYTPLWTSVWVSFIAAAVGTVMLFMLTFGIKRMPGRLANSAMLLSALPVGVPGMVLGLSYIFTFNTAVMPWGMLYGSALLIGLCNYYHYHTQGYATMMTGMRYVPTMLEDATTVLGGGVLHALRDVYLPVVKTTLITVALFLFMRSMVTLSAVIFLTTPKTPMAAVTVMRLDEAGFTSQAAAFSTCIMVIVGTIAGLLHYLTTLGKRTRAPH